MTVVDLEALREDVERWEVSIPRVDGTFGTSEYVAAAYRMAALVRAVLDAPVVWWCEAHRSPLYVTDPGRDAAWCAWADLLSLRHADCNMVEMALVRIGDE